MTSRTVLMNELEVGKLISAVENLTKTVDALSTKVDELESQLDRGKGVIIGIFLIAGFLGAAGSTLIHKAMSFIGGS